jgi:8-oxo-dGTP diphosphatase
MPIVLLRHASAGERDEWDGDDRLRPLDDLGRVQAAALVEGLSSHRVTRILSSPYVRCVQTVEPLADHVGLPIEVRGEVADDAVAAAALSLLREVADTVAVACTHRAVITALIGQGRPCPKGAAWILEATADGFAPTAYLPEPQL